MSGAWPSTCALHPQHVASLARPSRTPHPPSWTDRRYGGVPLTLKRAGVAAVATVQAATVQGATVQGATVRGTLQACMCTPTLRRRAAHDREGARAKALGGGVAAHRGEVVHAALRRLPAVTEVQLPVAHRENKLLFTGVVTLPLQRCDGQTCTRWW